MRSMVSAVLAAMTMLAAHGARAADGSDEGATLRSTWESAAAQAPAPAPASPMAVTHATDSAPAAVLEAPADHDAGSAAREPAVKDRAPAEDPARQAADQDFLERIWTQP